MKPGPTLQHEPIRFISPYVDLRMQTYTEPVPLKYGKLATKYRWIYGVTDSVGQRQSRGV